jgi:HEAT repeat protein
LTTPTDTSVVSAIEALGDARSPRQEEAVQRLSSLRSAAVPALIEALREDRLGGVGRARILRLLAACPVEDALPDVLAALDDARHIARSAAIVAVAAFGDPRATAALVGLLDDADPDIVQHTASVLGERREQVAVRPLIRLLSRAEQGVRYSATKALRAVGNREATAALAELRARETDPEIRALIEGNP